MIVGTAGHIDHGKTSLVRTLTGVDTDRLKEEKTRGISIELGFAYLPAPDGQIVGFVDVPGHEKLVHTMLAGASGIDVLRVRFEPGGEHFQSGVRRACGAEAARQIGCTQRVTRTRFERFEQLSELLAGVRGGGETMQSRERTWIARGDDAEEQRDAFVRLR